MDLDWDFGRLLTRMSRQENDVCVRERRLRIQEKERNGRRLETERNVE